METKREIDGIVFKNDFIEYIVKNRNLAMTTASEYNYAIGRYLNYLNENELEIDNLKPADMQNYVKSLRNQNLSAHTVHRQITSVNSFYKYLQKLQVIAYNPLIYIDLPKKPKRLPIYITEEQIDSFLSRLNDYEQKNTIIGYRNSAIFTIILYNGLRISEALNLKYENLIFKNNEVDKIRIIGKGNKERELKLHSNAKDRLKKWLLIRENLKDPEISRKYTCRSPKELHSNFIFPGSKGEALNAKTAQNALKTILGDNFKKITPHKLRHTCATMLHKRDVKLNLIQKILGHENISTTTIYTHIENRELDAVFEE